MSQTESEHEAENPRPTYRPDVYPWIRAWGQLCRYSMETIESQIARAITEQAPIESIYRFDQERWQTLKDVSHVESRIWLVDWTESRDLHLPASVLRVWLDPYVPVEP